MKSKQEKYVEGTGLKYVGKCYCIVNSSDTFPFVKGQMYDYYTAISDYYHSFDVVREYWIVYDYDGSLYKQGHWFSGLDHYFLTNKEYRKMKLDKINNENSNM